VVDGAASAVVARRRRPLADERGAIMGDTERVEPVVVVGVDASPEARQALRWASRYALMTGARLRVRHAWTPVEELVWVQSMPPPAGRMAVAEEEVAKMVAADVDPGVPVDARVVEGHAVKVLADAAEDADLLVVGGRGHGGFAGLLVGSVTAQVVAHSPCSVAVIKGGSESA
jgi:nucleotide-binding universal stress UspA family protein